MRLEDGLLEELVKAAKDLMKVNVCPHNSNLQPAKEKEDNSGKEEDLSNFTVRQYRDTKFIF